jgi:hypothetical protein
MFFAGHPLCRLFLDAFAPYAEMIDQWCKKGELADTNAEFMVHRCARRWVHAFLPRAHETPMCERDLLFCSRALASLIQLRVITCRSRGGSECDWRATWSLQPAASIPEFLLPVRSDILLAGKCLAYSNADLRSKSAGQRRCGDTVEMAVGPTPARSASIEVVRYCDSPSPQFPLLFLLSFLCLNGLLGARPPPLFHCAILLSRRVLIFQHVSSQPHTLCAQVDELRARLCGTEASPDHRRLVSASDVLGHTFMEGNTSKHMTSSLTPS